MADSTKYDYHWIIGQDTYQDIEGSYKVDRDQTFHRVAVLDLPRLNLKLNFDTKKGYQLREGRELWDLDSIPLHNLWSVVRELEQTDHFLTTENSEESGRTLHIVDGKLAACIDLTEEESFEEADIRDVFSKADIMGI